MALTRYVKTPNVANTPKIDEIETNIKLIDCVGYVVDGANGYQDELGNPRLVKTPWYEE